MSTMSDRSGRNKGRHSDIVRATKWEPLTEKELIELGLQPGTKPAKTDTTNIELLANQTDKGFWDSLLSKVLGSED